jgi:hypothetical protein
LAEQGVACNFLPKIILYVHCNKKQRSNFLVIFIIYAALQRTLRGMISSNHMFKKFFSSMMVSVSMLALSAAPAFAETTATVTAAPVRKTVDLACMVAAVDAREVALQTAFTTFGTAQTAALTTRASALHTAWGMTDAKARRTALKTAWNTYRTSHRAAVSAHRTAHNSAWSAFRTAAKTCKGNSYEEPGSSSESSLN